MKRFLSVLLFAFCGFVFGDEASDVASIKTAAWEAVSDLGVLVDQGNEEARFDTTLLQHLDNVLGYGDHSLAPSFWEQSMWLRNFLAGSVDYSSQTAYPQFRFLSAPVGRLQPANGVSAQSLTYFLNMTLGQNIDYRPGDDMRRRWEELFTTNSVFRDVTSAGSVEKIGYSSFNVWLAEAMRRTLTNQIDFAAGGRESWQNSEDGSPYPEEGNTFATNSPVVVGSDLDRPNGVSWFDAGVVQTPGWTLEGSPSDPTVFDAVIGGERMVLKIPFSLGGGVWRSVTTFCVSVVTACVLVGIVRSEIDYWTTLGGSAS